MSTNKKPKIIIPLYIANYTVCGFLGQIVFGDIEDIREDDLNREHCFIFFLNEVISLYQVIIECAKYYGGLEPRAKKTSFMKKTNVTYTCSYSSKRLEGQEEKFSTLSIENKDGLVFEISFNERAFGQFIDAVSIALWQCLGLNQKQLCIFQNYLELPLNEFLLLKDLKKLKKFLKEYENSFHLAQLTRYHFSTLIIIHKLNNLYNEENLTLKIRDIFEVS